jgi:hypothetical protein
MPKLAIGPDDGFGTPIKMYSGAAPTGACEFDDGSLLDPDPEVASLLSFEHAANAKHITSAKKTARIFFISSLCLLLIQDK